jgi:hypothetical protein
LTTHLGRNLLANSKGSDTTVAAAAALVGLNEVHAIDELEPLRAPSDIGLVQRELGQIGQRPSLELHRARTQSSRTSNQGFSEQQSQGKEHTAVTFDLSFSEQQQKQQ